MTIITIFCKLKNIFQVIAFIWYAVHLIQYTRYFIYFVNEIIKSQQFYNEEK